MSGLVWLVMILGYTWGRCYGGDQPACCWHQDAPVVSVVPVVSDFDFLVVPWLWSRDSSGHTRAHTNNSEPLNGTDVHHDERLTAHLIEPKASSRLNHTGMAVMTWRIHVDRIVPQFRTCQIASPFVSRNVWAEEPIGGEQRKTEH
mmetsp:Transcript_13097/g.36178  ORF Transcript_13097/g.36178 Transcript_13097/m.36178 type:complete len:146 (+) Transcript_13097:744-1181(+)